MNKLPKGWTKTTLGEIVQIIKGISFKKADLIKESSDSVRVLRGGNVQEDKYYFLDDDYFIPKSFVSEEQLLKKDDVIIVSSTGSKKAIGKAAIITKDYNNVSVGAFLRIIRASSVTYKKFVAYYFLYNGYRNYIRHIVKGVNINNIKDTYINQQEFLLPPLPEQRRIVSKIEELFSRLDEGVNKLKTVKIQIARYRQAVLKAAFEGELTKQWRKKEGIKFEYIAKKISDIVFINPKLPNKEIDDELEVSFLPMKAVDEETGKFDLTETRLYSQVKKGYTPFIDNDVIFAKITPCMENGKAAVVRNLKNGIGFGSTEFHVFRAKDDSLVPEYLFYFLIQRNFRQEAKKNMTGAVGQMRVPANYIAGCEIPLPSKIEQLVVVSEIKRLFSVCDNAEKLVDENLKRAEKLRQCILKRAFEGKLVPQDPNDEPADVLLERIKQEKAKIEKEMKNRRKKTNGKQ